MGASSESLPQFMSGEKVVAVAGVVTIILLLPHLLLALGEDQASLEWWQQQMLLHMPINKNQAGQIVRVGVLPVLGMLSDRGAMLLGTHTCACALVVAVKGGSVWGLGW